MQEQLKKLTKIVDDSVQITNFQDQDNEEQAINEWLQSIEIKEFIDKVTGEF
jgi:hypothetical protein